MKHVLYASALAAGLMASANAQAQKPSPQKSPFASAKNAQATLVTPNTSAAVGGNDDCIAPTPLMGQGSFAYDNSAATTGAEGQADPACDFFGNTGIDNDIWFAWTADADGMATIDTCGSLDDTKIAAYDGAGCPSGAPISCNDDTCGLQSEISFAVTAGTTYTLQVGNFPGSAGGANTLNVGISGPTPPPACYEYDDGSTENAIGLTAGGDVGWIHAFDAIGGSDVITEVSSAFGSVGGGGTSPGLAGQVCVWQSLPPFTNTDPTTATLVYSGPITSSAEDTDMKVSFSIPDVAVTGVFFVGIVVENPVGQFPAPLDQSVPGGGNSWIVGSTLGAGTLDIANLGANDVAPLDVDAIGFPGVWLLCATGDACAGDDGGIGDTFCVANANSVSPMGSSISASGSTSLADMDVSLSASNAPMNQGGLFFFGPAQNMAPFGCGNLCLAGTLVRLPVVFENMGEFNYDIDFGNFGADLATLGTVNFQCWYRDPANAGACGNTFNTSDGLEVVFTP